jgi:hypothetical protein
MDRKEALKIITKMQNRLRYLLSKKDSHHQLIDLSTNIRKFQKKCEPIDRDKSFKRQLEMMQHSISQKLLHSIH